MENLPTLRQMQYLLALADHRSFQKAADICAVTQSTLSGGLRDMEQILTSPVIDRTNRKQVRFTPLGEDIIREARSVVAAMQSITYRARTLTKPLSWPIRLGVIPTIAPYLLPRILKPLQDALPDLDLHIHELRSAAIVDKIHDGSLDLALMAFPYDTKGLAERTICTEEFICAAPPGYFAGKKSVTLHDIEGEKLLLLEDGHCLRDHALDACRLKPIAEMKTFSAASLSTLIQMVHQGYGITFLPAMAAEADALLPRKLTLRSIRGVAPTRKIGLAWKKGALREKDIGIVAATLKKLISG
jgi:LysR family hydrogen peroxide-inducible transcriptional activator